MPRAQNVHAIINAGFLFKIKNEKVQSSTIVFGNINPLFIHATNTEKYFLNKNIFDNTVLQGAFSNLQKELNPDYILPNQKPEFRKKLAISLLYKVHFDINFHKYIKFIKNNILVCTKYSTNVQNQCQKCIS